MNENELRLAMRELQCTGQEGHRPGEFPHVRTFDGYNLVEVLCIKCYRSIPVELPRIKKEEPTRLPFSLFPAGLDY